MLKTEGVYDEYCYNEISIGSHFNHSYLSSFNDYTNNSTLSRAKLPNSTLQTNLPDYITELPSFKNLSDVNEEDKDEDANADNEGENTTISSLNARQPDANDDDDNDEANTDEPNTDEPNADQDVNSNSESISVIKNVPSSSSIVPVTTTTSTPGLIRVRRDNGENRTTNQVCVSSSSFKEFN